MKIRAEALQDFNHGVSKQVVMFCDVSGFTKLAEAMAKSGMGAEGLAKYLNQVRR
jgi:class 3 adenylate cyclase